MLAVTSSSISRQLSNKYWIIFLVGSVVLHFALAMLLQKQVKIGAEPFEKSKPPIKTLDSYLVFKPKPQPLPQPKHETTTRPEVIEPVVQDPAPLSVKRKEQEIPEPEQEITKPNPMEAAANTTHAKPPAEQKKSDSELVYPGLDSASSNYFDRLNSTALSDVAQQEASHYYSNKNTVVLPKSGGASYGGKYGPGSPKPIQVDCSSTVKKGLVALNYLTGGRMNCYSASNFQPFIDARLNKSSKSKNAR